MSRERERESHGMMRTSLCFRIQTDREGVGGETVSMEDVEEWWGK